MDSPILDEKCKELTDGEGITLEQVSEIASMKQA